MNINATLIAQLIVFLILVIFTIKFVWPPIVKALDERANKIAEGLAAAERGKSDAEQAEKRVAETLAEGRQQVAERNGAHGDGQCAGAFPRRGLRPSPDR